MQEFQLILRAARGQPKNNTGLLSRVPSCVNSTSGLVFEGFSAGLEKLKDSLVIKKGLRVKLLQRLFARITCPRKT